MLALDHGPTLVRRSRRDAAELRRLSTIGFYDRSAEEYAAATLDLDVSGHLIRFAGLLPPGGRVLDVGCGAGRDLLSLRAAGLLPYGLERSRSLAAIARGLSGLAVEVGDLREPPYEPASFDGVWAMASLLHLERGETVSALRGLGGLLRPGGVLFASVKRGCGRVRDDEGRWFTLHDEDGWSRHLRDAGMEVIEVVGQPPAAQRTIGSVAPGWVCSLSRRPG